MSTKYKATTTEDRCFMSITTVGWIDIFTRLNRKYFITKALTPFIPLECLQMNKRLSVGSSAYSLPFTALVGINFLSVEQISKSYGMLQLFENVSF